MTIFTAADGQVAAERLAAEQQAIAESLINLEDHLGRRLLDSTAVEGVTRKRRTDVLDGFARLWTLYETYLSAAGRVRAIMERRSRPTRADLREVEELVSGATVALPNPDGLLPGPQVTLEGLVAEIQAVYSRVHEVVTAVERVWAELSPRFDRGDTLLREARTLAADLDLSADQDQAAAVLAQLADRLATVRRIALADPLRLWLDDAVDTAEVDQLISRCVGAHADLHALGELRQHAQRSLDQIDATLTETRRLAQEISAERRRVNQDPSSAGTGTGGSADGPAGSPAERCDGAVPARILAATGDRAADTGAGGIRGTSAGPGRVSTGQPTIAGPR